MNNLKAAGVKLETVKAGPMRAIAVIVMVLVVIGLAVVIRRILNLAGVIKPYVNPKFGAFDKGFGVHPVLTLVHIIPGALFLILAPLQFITNIRLRHSWFHRWSGRLIVVLGLIIGISALIMSFTMAIGGPNETTATAVFAVLFFVALGKGFYHIRRHEVALHRVWMIRMFAICIAIASVRPIVGMFFAFSKLPPSEFFGIAFWLGFTMHLIAAEVWINYTQKAKTSRQ